MHTFPILYGPAIPYNNSFHWLLAVVREKTSLLGLILNRLCFCHIEHPFFFCDRTQQLCTTFCNIHYFTYIGVYIIYVCLTHL